MGSNPTTLLGYGRAAVVGLPRNFSLSHVLRTARSVRIATAFAHMSGWRLIAPSIRRTKARVQILTGLDFCQTEPTILREWLKLSRTGQVSAYLYPKSPPNFHPKVMIVESRNLNFAIVGSGNLSAGGLCDNVECSAYISNSLIVRQLIEWFEREVAYCDSIIESEIDNYEPKYLAALKARKRVQAKQNEAEEDITTTRQSRLLTWKEAIRHARRFFASKGFLKKDRAQWAKSAKDIRRALRMPRFNFDRTEWKKFFEIEELGDLVPIYRNQLFRRRNVLQKGLRRLIDESIPIHTRINALLDSKRPIALRGLGINVVTKILAAHQSNKWPVFNGPVKKVLSGFGYEEPHGEDVGGKYAAFSRLMSEFKQQSGAPDMVSLDCFFYRQSQTKR